MDARIRGVRAGLAGLSAAVPRLPLASPALDAALCGGLPTATLHEVLAEGAGDLGAAHGFALALAARITGSAGRALWIQAEGAEREDGAPYAPGLAMHGLDPARLVLVRARDVRAVLWAMEQALRCRALAAVIGEIVGTPRLYDLTASRRLVLAAREGGVTGLLVHAAAGEGGAGKISSAAATRWIVAAHPSRPGLAGEPGPPAWRLRLARSRGGREGTWIVEWDHDARIFNDIAEPALPRGDAAFPRDRPAASVATLRRSA